MSEWVSQWVSQWQGHLLSCFGQLKIIHYEQATDRNPDYEPSSIYDGMYEDNQATDSHDDTYDHMYEHD